MSEEESQEEAEAKKEVVEEEKVKEPVKEPCLTLPDHMKPLVDCCKEFEEGKVDEGDVALRTLEFMQAVRKRRESASEEEAQVEEEP